MSRRMPRAGRSSPADPELSALIGISVTGSTMPTVIGEHVDSAEPVDVGLGLVALLAGGDQVFGEVVDDGC